MLTGRQHLLGKLRQRGGMAGFPEPRATPTAVEMPVPAWPTEKRS
ncbi:MAG: hypothetical protein ACKOTD_00495 [Phycisphaerales bacterium]